jgi:hypothetical protein
MAATTVVSSSTVTLSMTLGQRIGGETQAFVNLSKIPVSITVMVRVTVVVVATMAMFITRLLPVVAFEQKTGKLMP